MSVHRRVLPERGYRTAPSGKRRSIGLILTILVHAILLGLFFFQLSIRYTKPTQTTLSVFDIAPPAAPPEADLPPEPETVETPPIPPPPIDPEIKLPNENPIVLPPSDPTPPAPKAPVQESRPTPPAPRPSDAKPTWQGKVLAALNKEKRYPSLASARREQGMPWIRFTMNRQGRLLSVALERSSGFAALDAEALALPHRAQPFPKPPDEVTGETIELVVPVEFFLR